MIINMIIIHNKINSIQVWQVILGIQKMKHLISNNILKQFNCSGAN